MSRAPLCPRVDTSRRLEWEPPFTCVVRGCRYSAGGSLSWLGGLDRSCQLLVFGVGLWASYRAHPGRGAPPGHLLAGCDAGWNPVGAALVASSSGSEHIVVLAGKLASSGVEVARFEILSSLTQSLSVRLGVRTILIRERDLHGGRPPAPIFVFGRESCQAHRSHWLGTGAPTGAWCRGPGCAEGARCSQAENPCRLPEAAPSVHLRHARRRRRQSLREWGRCGRCSWRRASGARCGSAHWPVPPARHCRAAGGPRELILIASVFNSAQS